MFNTFFYCTVLFTGCSAKQRFCIARILQNRGHASANALSVKSDLFSSTLILDNIQKRFVILSSSRPINLIYVLRNSKHIPFCYDKLLIS